MTFRELLQMADGRRRHDARMIAALRASIANGALKKRSKQLWTPDDFDPYVERRPTKSNIPLDKKGFTWFRRLVFGIR